MIDVELTTINNKSFVTIAKVDNAKEHRIQLRLTIDELRSLIFQLSALEQDITSVFSYANNHDHNSNTESQS